MFQFPFRQSHRFTLTIGAFILAAVLAGFLIDRSKASGLFDELQTSAVPTLFTYQGQLRNNSVLVNSQCDFEFELWTLGSGGSTVASTNSIADVPVSDGQFAVDLDFGDSFPTNGERWLEVKVRCPAGSGDYTSLGRQQLTATPYALTANNADTLDSLDSSSFSLTSHNHAGQDWPTVNTTYGLRVDNVGSYGLYAAGGSTGVYGSGASYGLYGVSTDIAGVYGDGGSGSGDYGGYFTGYNGVYGNAENASGYGVYGNASGYGVYGNGGSYGVYGNGGSYGVYGNGSTYGVYGNSSSNYGVFGNSGYTGVWGQGTSYGVIGINASTGVYGSGSTYGVFSSGPAYVSGFLTKAGGGFKIDHPKDPDNKYLVHSFVESPDMMNVYNGNVTLDANGEAWVDMPGYFEALNMDFRYQLTPIGGPGPNLYVASEIQDNRFQIAGGEVGLKVSWQVTGIRNDPWAQENRPEVEPVKPGDEQGTLLHPEVYGQPIEKGFDYLFGPSDSLLINETRELTDGR